MKINPDNKLEREMWDCLTKIFFKFEGGQYYLYIIYNSPYDFEYDIWNNYGEGKINNRVTDKELVDRITKYINRKKKIDKILGNIK